MAEWYGATEEWYKPGMKSVDQLTFNAAVWYPDLYNAVHETIGLVWVWVYVGWIRWPQEGQQGG